MISFSDIFKSSFLENFAAVSPIDLLMAMLLSFALGLFILFVYKRTNQGVMASDAFGISLVALTMISAFVILAVTSNVVLSLGMVGALSIVRFRTAVKEPLDLVFLFWSISVGIVLAAGMLPLALFGSLFIGLVLILFVNRRGGDTPYIVILSCDGQESEERAVACLRSRTARCVTRAKTVRAGAVELHAEVRLKGGDSAFVNELSALPGVDSAVMVSYHGEYLH